MKQKILWLTIACIIITVAYYGFYLAKKTTEEHLEETVDTSIVEPSEDQTEEVKEEPQKIQVDIKGAVKKPGVYEFEEGKRVIDAIKKAGDLTKNANTNALNLSKYLEDQMVIIVYTDQEMKEFQKEKNSYQTPEQPSCPNLENDACTNTNEPVKETSKISINQATLEQLETLPGIGESKAQNIITYRKENNGFKQLEELQEVTGIGESVYQKIKDLITL